MEVVVRAAVVFLFLWLVTRLVGKRELAELSTFELLLFLTIGDLVQQGVTQEDTSTTGALLAVGTFAILIVALGYLSYRFPRAATLVEGAPVIVVRDGRLLRAVMKAERLTENELLEGAREQGIEDLAEVKLGILETDGKFSFLKVDGADSQPAPEKPKG